MEPDWRRAPLASVRTSNSDLRWGWKWSILIPRCAFRVFTKGKHYGHRGYYIRFEHIIGWTYARRRSSSNLGRDERCAREKFKSSSTSNNIGVKSSFSFDFWFTSNFNYSPIFNSNEIKQFRLSKRMSLMTSLCPSPFLHSVMGPVDTVWFWVESLYRIGHITDGFLEVFRVFRLHL